MDLELFERLHNEGLISDQSLDKMKAADKSNLVSVHWELTTLLYLGVLMLTTGLGILVYENIDSIGHTVVLLFIAAVSAGGYLYCLQKKLPFSTSKVGLPDIGSEYLLLLSSICFVILIGYWQYQYHIFGSRFGLLTFIPMIFLFFTAYFFDHLGILCLAITNLCAWAGVVVTPNRILKDNDFNSSTLIATGMAIGIILLIAGKLTLRRKIKPHFAFTYTNFGMNILFISCLAGLFHFQDLYLLWFLALAGIVCYFYLEALREKSFYFLLMLTLYFYFGLSYVVISLPIWGSLNSDGLMLLFLYFIGSGIGLILFLIRMNRKLKSNDRSK